MKQAEPSRILVIDDDPSTVEIVRGWYGNSSFEIIAAKSGETGLAAVAADPPDLILLDIKMPGIDGIEVANQLKSNARTQPILHYLPGATLLLCKLKAPTVSTHAPVHLVQQLLHWVSCTKTLFF